MLNISPSAPVRRLLTMAFAALLICFIPRVAQADVFGRLAVHVRNSETQAPLRSARVLFHDPTGVRADVPALTDSSGTVLSPPLENHAWVISTQVVTFVTDTRTVSIASDTTTDVNINLIKSVIRGTTTVTVRTNPTTTSTHRTLDFINKFPVTAGNPQSLSKLLIANPGFVQSSVNSVHPRGEHASTSIYVNGFLVPGALQGRAGQILSPDTIQGADIQTGSYAPEYGSETAAVLNLSLRSGPVTPFQTVSVDAGNYKTLDQELTFGGQGGAALNGGGGGDVPRRFRYLVNLSDRSTDNSLEPPQPNDQSAHNHGISDTLFGNFEYIATPHDQISFVINSAPAHTQIANRTGLSGEYAPVGQGYGYGGARDADGTEAGADPTTVGGGTLLLPSQQGAGQDIYQNDDNTFSLANLRHTFSPKLTGLLSLGLNHSGLDIKNHDPGIDLSSVNPDGTLTTIDNSIEFNPDIQRSSTQKEVAGSLTLAQGPHTYKAGFTLNGQTGDESYQFTPQSQLALDALYATDARLAPAGTANGATDALGNPVYLINPSNTTTPTIRIHRTGYYNAGYVQDTWRTTSKLTLNYGLRLDGYGQKEDLGSSSYNQSYLSPRLNAAYALAPKTTLRLSYDKLFTQPPLAQGAVLGTTLKPQITDAYETGVEQRLSPGQTVKVSAYYKNDHNQNDTGILIPYTQIGAYTTLQYTHAGIHGLEFSYDLTPQAASGVGAFVNYTNSLAKPNGLDQTGADAPTINDHDQRHTVSAGLNYTLPSQAFGGLEYYFGSGEASSVLAPIGPSNTNLLNGGNRNSHSQYNLRLSSPPLGHAGSLELDVQNLFDKRDVLNFNSGFSGTRFQQGRTVLLRLTGTF